MLRILDLFSGIGMFSYGLEQTGGFRTVAFCEIEPYPRAVLAKHWPEVPCYSDVSDLTAGVLASDGIAVDVICGGFPCQDVSIAGRGEGLTGKRSGLWHEFARLIEEIGPRWAIIENVPALRSRGLDQILGFFAEIGYSVEWHCIPASALGAPHRRDRIWLVAYPDHGSRRWIEPQWRSDWRDPDIGGDGAIGQMDSDLADSNGGLRGGPIGVVRAGRHAVVAGGQAVADTEGRGRRIDGYVSDAPGGTPAGQFAHGGEALADGSGTGLSSAEQPGWQEPIVTAADIGRAIAQCRWGRAPPGMGGTADGDPPRMDGSRPVEAWEKETPRTVGRGYPNRPARLRALGNSIVPWIPELIGRAILRREDNFRR